MLDRVSRSFARLASMNTEVAITEQPPDHLGDSQQPVALQRQQTSRDSFGFVQTTKIAGSGSHTIQVGLGRKHLIGDWLPLGCMPGLW